jgi:hypothetical protein
MNTDSAAIVSMHSVYEYYGHDIEEATARDVTRWKLVHGQFRLSTERSKAVIGEMAGHWDTIPEVGNLLQRFIEVAANMTRTVKERSVYEESKCAHCRNTGQASRFDPDNRASTQTVACFCNRGKEWAEKCAVGKNPIYPVFAGTDLAAREDIVEFSAHQDAAATDWAKRNGLDFKDPEFTDKFRKVFAEMKGTMFQSVSWKDENSSKVLVSARQLTQVMRIRPIQPSDIPEGWEPVVYLGGGEFKTLRPGADGLIQPHPQARIQKIRSNVLLSG